MINVPVILYRELNLGEKSGGKETGKKDQEDYSTFPCEIWLEFYLGIIFFPPGFFGLGFYQNSLLEVMTLKSLIMRLWNVQEFKIPENFNISFCRLYFEVK